MTIDPRGAAGPNAGWRKAAWAAAAILWLLPLVAMQFSAEMRWDRTDFIVWGAMLVAAAGCFEFAARISRSKPYLVAVMIAVGAAFLMTWANLAVGIIGNENNPYNVIFFGVIAIAIIGALVARFRARGMMMAMLATAIAQTLAAALAYFLDGAYIFVLTACFVALWLASAWLFRSAARADCPA
jgi:hypothetical protein